MVTIPVPEMSKFNKIIYNIPWLHVYQMMVNGMFLYLGNGCLSVSASLEV